MGIQGATSDLAQPTSHIIMDPELLQLKLAYHEAMVERLQDHKPEIALIWLSGAELLRKRLQSMGINPDEPVVGQMN